MPILDVEDILEERQNRLDYWAEVHTRLDDLVGAYHGNFQKLWPGEFRRGEVPKVANWIKLGWDRYAGLVGKVPRNHVPTSSLKRMTQRKADKIEKILAHYDVTSRMTKTIKRYSWWLVGGGIACLGVIPDPVIRGPRYVVKDPRTVLAAPGQGSMPGTSTAYGMMSKPLMNVVSMQSVIINETVTASWLLDTYGRNDDMMMRLDRILDKSNGRLSTPYNHIMYMDKDVWQIVVQEELVGSVEHGLGYVPWRQTIMDVPDQLGGQGQFEQNIGLVLAFMKTLNQKLTYNENVVWPWIVMKGLADIDPQDRTITIMDPNGDAGFLSPPAELQADRDLEVLDRLIRVMNRDTEAMQGESPSSFATGRAIEELNRDVSTVVQDYWEVMTEDLEFLKSAALAMDEKVYGSVKKEMRGSAKGEPFEEEYVPRIDINGHINVGIDFGIGLGGNSGFVQLMQVAAQGYADEQTVMEGLPWIKSVSETRRKVLLDRIERLILEGMAGGMPAPILNHLGSWREAIQRGRTDPWKWITKNPFPEPEPELGAPGAPGAPPSSPPGAPGPGAAPQLPGVPSPAQILSLAQGRQQ